MKAIKQCDECKSNYFGETAEMMKLCPECAYYLYGYAPCHHVFINGHCLICGWDGSHSHYIQTLIADYAKNT